MSDGVLTPNVIPVDKDEFYADPAKWMACASQTVRVVVLRGDVVHCVIGGSMAAPPTYEEQQIVDRLTEVESQLSAVRSSLDRIERALQEDWESRH